MSLVDTASTLGSTILTLSTSKSFIKGLLSDSLYESPESLLSIAVNFSK